MSKEQLLSSLSVDRVRQDIEHITERIPSRLAGSENARRMAEFSAAQLAGAGASAQIHSMPGLVSFPEKGELRILSPVEIAVEANTLGHSVATLPDGISGEVIDVRSGAFDEYRGQDATGRITLSELSYSPARHEKQRIAALKGSTGCIMMNWGHPENTAVPFGSVKPVWGNPTPDTYRTEMATLPCIGISRTAGLHLRDLIRNGPVRVWLRANVENGWRNLQITVGELLPADDSDFVVVGGHQDSWPGAQATDNAAGNACMLELARVFAAHREELRRGLVFGFWMAHETGTMIGSSWYVDRNWDRLRERAVAYLQIDQPACIGHTEWIAASNAELRRSHQAIEAQMLEGRRANWKRAPKTGDSSFFGIGIPMLAAQGSFTAKELEATGLATHGWWHHSIENTIDKLDWAYMQVHLRIYAAWLWELCTAPVLPYEFVSSAAQFIDRLKGLRLAGDAVGLATALARAEALRDAAAQLEERAETWRRRYADGKSKDEAAAQILNTCLKTLSRRLIPLASTAKGTYGHDPYGFTPQGTMIPSLYDVPRLADLPADAEQRWMLETALIRERNRVADILDDCRGMIQASLRELDRC